MTTDLVVDGAGCSGRGRLTVLHLAWTTADPLAVRVVLTTEPDHPALPRGQWVLLRDFLRYGLEEPTGDGDVRLHPDTTLDRVEFTLTDPHPDSRATRCWVPQAPIRTFLAHTDRLVPSGAEGSAQALDAIIDRLLRT